MKTKYIVTAMVAALGLASTQASAELVEEWTATVELLWQPPASFSSGSGSLIENDTLLSWGASSCTGTGCWGAADIDTAHEFQNLNAGNSRSALVIDVPSVTDSLFTGDSFDTAPILPTNVVTHWNNEISGTFSTLESATLLSRLTLTPLNPPGDELDPVSRTFPIRFSETPNTTANCGWDPFATVDDGAGNLISNPDYNACSDIFVVNAEDLLFSFNYKGFKYTTQIVANGLGPLPAGACNVAGAPFPCVGVITEEFAKTSIPLGVQVKAEAIPVPTPGTLGLLGLGLLGVGAVAARRQRRIG